MSPDWPWDVLGLDAAPQTPKDIRHTAARKLKTIDQVTDIDGFTTLRMTYQFALHLTQNPDGPKSDPIPPAPHFEAPTPQPIVPDQLELARLETVLKDYGQGHPLAERIAETLAHPLSASPEHAAHLRQVHRTVCPPSSG